MKINRSSVDLISSLEQFNNGGECIEGFEVIDDVYVRFKFFDINLPLVIAFANAHEVIPVDETKNLVSPWGFDFLNRYEVNILSFATIGTATWYRSPMFHQFLETIKPLLNFQDIYGYGGSMGGYAVGAFETIFNYKKVLLLNPISTLNADYSPWETRFRDAMRKYQWDNQYYDGATSQTPGYIVYDNLFNLDRLHAERYSGLIHLHVPGVGHSIPAHLVNLNVLKNLFEQFIYSSVNRTQFYKGIRRRKLYTKYYEWLLSSQNTHLTPKRKAVIQKHYMALMGYLGRAKEIKSLDSSFVFALRDAALLIEDSNLALSYRLMKAASEMRPDGKFIQKKVEFYESQILKES